MFSLLEGDGVIENIFHLLWTKDSIFGRESYVMIPDTIIFKYQKPCYWYFTSKQDNKIKKKSTSKLTNELIKEHFLSNVSKSGIVAYFLYRKSVSANKLNNFNGSEIANSDKEELNSHFTIEYFDKNNFENFFENIPNYNDGILQKFEDPKGDYNFTLRLIWSPKICIFEKRTNLKNLYNNKFSIYEKVVTYDGEEFQSRNESIMGNNLPDRLEKIGNSIATHISNVTLERIKIARMILNFKITSNDTIILLWCSSLRLENNMDKKYPNSNNPKHIEKYKECEINKIKINLSDNVNMFKFSYKGKPIRPIKDSSCISCQQKIESYKLNEITFKYIIESHDNRKRDRGRLVINDNIPVTSTGIEVIPYIECKPQSQVSNYSEKMESKRQFIINTLIPPIINHMFPKMKYEEYLHLKYENMFSSKIALVCEECYIEITKYCNVVGANNLNLVKRFKPFNGSVYTINKNNEVKMFFNKVESMQKTSYKESCNFLRNLFIKRERNMEKLRNRTVTNQMFLASTKPNTLPNINKKDNLHKTFDKTYVLHTHTNNETHETDMQSIIDSYHSENK